MHGPVSLLSSYPTPGSLLHTVVLTLYRTGLLNSLIGLPQTEIGLVLKLVNKKSGLVCSLLLCRIRLPIAGEKLNPLTQYFLLKTESFEVAKMVGKFCRLSEIFVQTIVIYYRLQCAGPIRAFPQEVRGTGGMYDQVCSILVKIQYCLMIHIW